MRNLNRENNEKISIYKYISEYHMQSMMSLLKHTPTNISLISTVFPNFFSLRYIYNIFTYSLTDYFVRINFGV